MVTLLSRCAARKAAFNAMLWMLPPVQWSRASCTGSSPSVGVSRGKARCHISARSRGIEAKIVVRRGAPWEKIHNVAADEGADLIVVGARGQRGMSEVLGSVAERLVRAATRPVLIVPHGADARAV